MIFASVVLAATLSEPPQAPEDARAVVVKGAEAFDELLGEAKTYLQGDLIDEPLGPRTGLFVFSPPEPGPDGLHALWVIDVFPDGPAERAGVMPGDRILAIGPRKLEHETTATALDLLDLVPGPVTLTLSRGGTELQVTVARAPLPCMLAIPDVIGRNEWLARFASLRELVGMVREKARDESLTLEQLVALKQELERLYVKFQAMDQVLIMSINGAILSACRAQPDP
jgi:hypothetical protein